MLIYFRTETSGIVAQCIVRNHMKSLAACVNQDDTTEHFTSLSLYAELVSNQYGSHLVNVSTCDILLPWLVLLKHYLDSVFI